MSIVGCRAVVAATHDSRYTVGSVLVEMKERHGSDLEGAAYVMSGVPSTC